jgi:hypothetical protein
LTGRPILVKRAQNRSPDAAADAVLEAGFVVADSLAPWIVHAASTRALREPRHPKIVPEVYRRFTKDRGCLGFPLFFRASYNNLSELQQPGAHSV